MWGDLMKPITRKEKLIAGEELTPITRKEMFLKKYGGASSWNDLTDKPFGESIEIVNEPLNITWDGNTEGLESIDAGGGVNFYMISDVVLTDEDVKSATITVYGQSVQVSSVWAHLMVIDEAISFIPLDLGMFVIKKAPLEVVEGVIFPKAGIWVDNIMPSLSFVGETERTKTVVHKLDKKFLPNEVNIFNVNISYDEANSKWVSDKTYDEIIAAEEARMPIVGTFTNINGKVYTLLGCDLEAANCQLSAFNVSNDSAPIIYKIRVSVDNWVSVTELTLTATAT